MVAASLSRATRKPLAATGFSAAIHSDFKDVSLGGGGQDRPGYRSATSMAASARASTSSIARMPLSSTSSSVRAIMASNARLRSSCSLQKPEAGANDLADIVVLATLHASACEGFQLGGEMHVRCHGNLHVKH